MLQPKEQDKTQKKNSNEMDISNLPDKVQSNKYKDIH